MTKPNMVGGGGGLTRTPSAPVGRENRKPPSETSPHQGLVPHLNIHGQQHHRTPFKAKQQYENLGVQCHPAWTRVPAYRSRTELIQARRTNMVPHASYDFDGDGVVGQRDYFIGKHFDKDHDDRLDPGERRAAENALKNGWLDKFHFGLDKSGVARQYPVIQRRGIVLDHDNGDEVSMTYPPHPTSHKVGSHSCKTEMEVDRRTEKKNAANDMKEKWDLSHPGFVPPNPPESEFRVENPPISNLCQRAEAEHQVARVKAGLLPSSTYINPEREQQHGGEAGAYHGNPHITTRTQLQETRKEQNRRDLLEQIIETEKFHVPYSVRQAQREVACFEYRKAEGDPLTLTKLHNNRKRDRIQYDQLNFGEKPKIAPRYSDQAVPFWILREAAGEKPASAPAGMQMWQPLGEVSEPTFKITEQEWPPGCDQYGRPGSAPTPLPDEDYRAPPQRKAPGPHLGANTKKRWTSERIESGAMRNAPRFFDSLKPATVLVRDFEPVEKHSSFELIRDASLKAAAESRKQSQEKSQKTLSQLGTQQSSGSRGGTMMGQQQQATAGSGLGRQKSAPSIVSQDKSMDNRSANSSSKNLAATDRTRGLTALGLGGTNAAVRAFGFPDQPGPSMMDRTNSAEGFRKRESPEVAVGNGYRAAKSRGGSLPPGGGGGGATATRKFQNVPVRTGGFQRLDETRVAALDASHGGSVCPPPPQLESLGAR